MLGTLLQIGSGIAGAIQGNKANKEGLAAANAQNTAMAASMAEQQAALQGLYANQPDPAELFKRIFSSMPELLGKVLPSLRKQAGATAEWGTASNLKTYDQAMQGLFPEYRSMQDRMLSLIKSNDPENLGQEELAAVSRKLAPFIPTGSVDTRTGAVAGGATSPVALYRNMINGMYSDRKDKFGSQLGAWLNNADNAAVRQQDRASQYLMPFLSMANNSGMGIAEQSLKQHQSNIAGQTALMSSFMAMPRATFDPSQGNKMMSEGIGGAVKALPGLMGGGGSTGGFGLFS